VEEQQTDWALCQLSKFKEKEIQSNGNTEKIKFNEQIALLNTAVMDALP
jgi:hypothetical protein